MPKGKRKPKELKKSSGAAEGAVERQTESTIPSTPMPTRVSKQIADPHLSTQASTDSSSKEIVPVYPSTSAMSVDEAMQKLGFELKHEHTTDWPFPKRPGVGIKGRKIRLLANRFVIDIPEGNVYHYDVVISNIRTSAETKEKKKYRCLNTRESRLVLEFAIKQTRLFSKMRPAYDGKKNLFTRNPLPIDEVTEIPVKFENKDYVIEIKPVNKKGQNVPEISLEPLHQLFQGKAFSVTEEMRLGIMALETILRHGPALTYVPVYRSFYYPPREGEVPPLGGGREIWLGYHQSLQISQWKPMINIDTSATVFYESGPVVHLMMSILYPNIREDRIDNELRNIRHLSDSQINTLLDELRNLEVEVVHLPYPRKYRIHNITFKGAYEIYFDEDIKGKKVRRSVSDYFRIKYPNHKLKYPNLPCIDGTKERNTYLPLEVCNIVSGQHCNNQLTDEQRKQIVQKTSFTPEVKFRKIKEKVEATKMNLERGSVNSPSFAKEFGIRINTTPTKLDGRVLEPPSLTYNLPQPILPVDGVWSMQRKSFFQSCEPIDKWVLASFSNLRDERELKRFADKLQEGGSLVGINIATPILMTSFHINTAPSSAFKKIREKYPDLQLVVVIVPSKAENKSIYREIKIFCETKIGLMTQCIIDKNARKCDRSVICNLCQKINAKMGGRNNSLASVIKPHIFQKPVIIIGADCTHPAPGDTVEPSIAAIVGSLDSGPSKYRASLRIQMPPPKEQSGNGNKDKPKPKEIIVELKDMVKEVLLAFYRYTKQRKPERIIFYRDGVSEGEFKQVRQEEVMQVRGACLEINKEYKPPITFIVVGKRHHTRFMPEFKGDGRGKIGNVPPGTTVDTVVTHPIYSDYFLCSHLGIQGTSRPAHYTVLCDDNNFNADELQILTYYLCYTYARCTRSISIPCPVMYAHLAAYRAKQYLYHLTKGKPRSVNVTIEEMKEAVKVVERMENEMYFT